MPAPTNLLYTDAIDIPILPASISQDVFFSGITYNVWYKITATFTGVISVSGFGDLVGYMPVTEVHIDPGGVNTVIVSGWNVPIMIPITIGETYYLYFDNFGFDGSPSILLLEVAEFVPQAIPDDSILVNSDQGGQPCALLSSVNGDDYNVLALPFPFTFGESGCIIRSSGNFLLSQESTGELLLYDSGFNILATVSYDLSGISTDGIRANQTLNQFFAGNATAGTILVINNDGSLSTLYTLPATNLNSLAASNDGSIIYVAGNGLSGHGLGGPIKRFLTATETFDTDLAAGVTNYGISSMLVLDDDSIVALYRSNSNSAALYAKRFLDDGTVLNTYSLVTGNIGQPRLAYASNSSTSFWVWFQNIAPLAGHCKFQEIQVSDGAVLREVEHITFNDNFYTAAMIATPFTLYGPSDSCPFLLTGTGGSPPPTDGVIIVEKVTVPSDATDFDFTAGGGLSPLHLLLLMEKLQLMTP